MEDENDKLDEEGEEEEEFHDPEMEKLDLNDQKWYVVKKGLDQVMAFCELCGVPQYYGLFIRNGFRYANAIRSITQHMLTTQFQLTDPDELESILSESANIVKFDELRNFNKRYGNPDALIFECTQGIAYMEEHPDWFPKQDLKAEQDKKDDPTQLTFEEKWRIPIEDLENFSATEGTWATASSCDGMVFLWPLDRPLDNAPPSPEEGIVYPGCVRCAYVHPAVTTDYTMDFERMMSVSVGGDCRVCAFDMAKNKIVATVKNDQGIDISHAFLCVDADFTVEKVAIGVINGPLKLGDFQRGKVVQVLKGHSDDIYDVKANWDENLIVTGSWDHTVGMFDVRSGKRVRTCTGHTEVINRIAVSWDQMMCISVGSEQNFMLWDLKDGRCVKPIEGHYGGNNDVVVNWKTMQCATGGEDGLVKLWDLESGECTKTFDFEPSHLQTLALDVDWDKNLLMTGSWDYYVRIWDLQTGKRLWELKKARRTITQVHLQGGYKT